MKVLFLCRGNIARSQMAEALFKKKVGNNFDVTSAGTKLSRGKKQLEEFGQIVENLITVMKEEGIDISKNVCKEVTKDMAAEADKIVLIVDDEDPVPDYLVENPKTIRWDLPDPKGESLEFYREEKEKIKNLIKNLLEKIDAKER